MTPVKKVSSLKPKASKPLAKPDRWRSTPNARRNRPVTTLTLTREEKRSLHALAWKAGTSASRLVSAWIVVMQEGIPARFLDMGAPDFAGRMVAYLATEPQRLTPDERVWVEALREVARVSALARAVPIRPMTLRTSPAGADYVVHVDRPGTDDVYCGRKRSTVNRTEDTTEREELCQNCVRTVRRMRARKVG